MDGLGALAHHLPDLQAGFGAVLRLRSLLASEREPTGGLSVPAGRLDVHFSELHFAYDEGRFALHDVELEVPAGTTCATSAVQAVTTPAPSERSSV